MEDSNLPIAARSGETHGIAFREFFVGADPAMYVQKWGRSRARARPPIILIHGGAHTGICWSECPDGRPGWVHRLTDLGWTSFVVDWPGVGRSGRGGPDPDPGHAPLDHVIACLTELLRQTGPALILAHSMGSAIAIKTAGLVPELVVGLIALAPSKQGDVPSQRDAVPTDHPIEFDEGFIRAFFANADRFPMDAFDRYRQTLCPLSPAIYNAIFSRDGAEAPAPSHTEHAGPPILVVAGDQDALVVTSTSQRIARSLGADHVLVGADWGLQGFGHMMPIETGSEAIVDRLSDWFETQVTVLSD